MSFFGLGVFFDLDEHELAADRAALFHKLNLFDVYQFFKLSYDLLFGRLVAVHE